MLQVAGEQREERIQIQGEGNMKETLPSRKPKTLKLISHNCSYCDYNIIQVSKNNSGKRLDTM